MMDRVLPEGLLPDIPRIYTAIAEWVACMLFILPMKKRFGKIVTGVIAGGILLVQCGFLMATDNINIYLWIPCMMIAVAIMIGFIFGVCDIAVTDAAYFGLIAFVIAEFLASMEWQVMCYWLDGRLPGRGMQVVFVALIYGMISLILYALIHKQLPKDGSMNVTHKEFLSALIMAVTVFAVSNLSYVTENTPFSTSYSIEIGNIRTMVDLGGVAILYAHLVQCCEIRVKRELEAVQNVLQNQYVQYKQSRDSIELINYKYHDLKHQIAFLRSEEDPRKRRKFLDKMEAEIKQYEAQNKTGNKVLDTVLTTKSLYCAKHDITFTCVADGTLLEFMDVMDTCSIFGNAIDNAIECELKITDKEKRLIHVTVSRQKNFLILRFENYYDMELKYKQGRLITTKKEKEYHGYGLKSIQYIADKYDGAVSIDTKNNWFDLKILIPMSDMEKAL